MIADIKRLYVYMGVRHINTFDYDANPVCSQLLLMVVCNFFYSTPESLIVFVIKMIKLINLYFWNHQRMRCNCGIDIQKHNGLFVLINLVTRYFAFDDLGKNCLFHTYSIRHHQITLMVASLLVTLVCYKNLVDGTRQPEEVITVPTEFFSKFSAGTIIQIITAVASIAAIYKFFIEFVQPNQLAVRARNNKIDHYFKPIEWWRLMLLIVYLGATSASVALLIRGEGTYFPWVTVSASAVMLWYALRTWPQTDIPALIGPGIKIKVPGYISYKAAIVAEDTRTVSTPNRLDQTGLLVDVQIAYV